MTNAPNNWILTPQGNSLNLAFLSKVLVMTAGSGAAWSVLYYHGIANLSSTKSGATIAEKYGSQGEAISAYNKVIRAIKGAVNMLDLSYQMPVEITSLDTQTGTAAGGTTVTLTGIGFKSGFKIHINGAAGTNLVFTDSTTVEFDTPPNDVGSYSLVYTDTDGDFIFPMAFTYS